MINATIKYIQLTYMPGDVNNDWLVDLGDVLYLISYLHKGGPEPQPELCVGEVNGQDPVDLRDLLYLISYLYKGGAPPLDGCE